MQFSNHHLQVLSSLMLLAFLGVSAPEASINISTTSMTFFSAAEAPDFNNLAISRMLQDLNRTRTPGQDAYAVFDWDNTCMFGDISYTAVLFQLEQLNYRIYPSQFTQKFSLGYANAESTADECLPQGLNSVLGQNEFGDNLTVNQVLQEMQRDYRQLFDLYIGPTYNLTDEASSLHLRNDPTARSLDQVKNTTSFRNFRANLGYFLAQMEALVTLEKERTVCGMRILQVVYAQLLVGMTNDEIRDLIRGSLRFNLASNLTIATFVSEPPLQVKGSFHIGLRVFNGQESVMRTLRTNGVDVYVISASPELFAQEAASLVGLSYNVPASNVFGVRFKIDGNGRFTGELVDNGYPITWGPGKAWIIENVLKPQHNDQPPVLVSGDSTGDCDMLELVTDGVVHVNNRLKSAPECIQTFYDKACALYGRRDTTSNSFFLIQGQDAAIGSWIRSGFSTKDGLTFASGAADSVGSCAGYDIFLSRFVSF